MVAALSKPAPSRKQKSIVKKAAKAHIGWCFHAAKGFVACGRYKSGEFRASRYVCCLGIYRSLRIRFRH